MTVQQFWNEAYCGQSPPTLKSDGTAEADQAACVQDYLLMPSFASGGEV